MLCSGGSHRRRSASGVEATIKFMGPGAIPEGYGSGSVDHIVPLSIAGTPGHVWSNVRVAHRSCNREAAGLVWLTHRVGHDWLDEHTQETFQSFQVELGVVKIEGSPRGPLYRVVARNMEALGSPRELLFPPEGEAPET